MRSSNSVPIGKMAGVGLMLRSAFRQFFPMPCAGQTRGYYVDWRMVRDVKRRKMAFDYADQRLRLNCLRKNKILPKELQEITDKEIADLPRDSCPVRIHNRCVLTSRPRGVKRDGGSAELSSVIWLTMPSSLGYRGQCGDLQASNLFKRDKTES